MDHRRDSESRGAALTPALVIAKAKSDSLQNIKNLNLWGNDLEVHFPPIRILDSLGKCPA